MTIAMKEPGKALRTLFVPNELSLFQQLVDGYIETITLRDGLIMIVNEEGKIRDLEPNFYFATIDDDIRGTALFVGADGEEFAEIRPQDLEFLRELFGREEAVNA